MSNALKDLKVSDGASLPDLSVLFADFETLKAQLKTQEKLKPEERDSTLSSKFSDAARMITEQAVLVRLTPDTDKILLEQLFRDEKVHPLATFDEYVQTRLGRPGDHKSAFALAARDKDGPRALTAIYTYYDSVACDPFGVVNPDDLRGDIHTIKTETPRALPDGYDPDIVYYYTVTSKIPKAAYTLIGKVAGLHKDLLNVTVSPAREFTKAQDMDAVELLPAAERTALVADYIATREGYDDMDPVAFFHMDNGNGAYAGSVKFNPGMPDDRVMMNYVYPSSPVLVLHNQQAFRAGYVTMARPLWSLLPDEKKDRVYAVDATLGVAPVLAPDAPQC
jgi:hypothetical protein